MIKFQESGVSSKIYDTWVGPLELQLWYDDEFKAFTCYVEERLSNGRATVHSNYCLFTIELRSDPNSDNLSRINGWMRRHKSFVERIILGYVLSRYRG